MFNFLINKMETLIFTALSQGIEMMYPKSLTHAECSVNGSSDHQLCRWVFVINKLPANGAWSQRMRKSCKEGDLSSVVLLMSLFLGPLDLKEVRL